ncbi:MAG: hypothetical protein LBM74_09120 [Oscillospiraceae bacterium]|jgi:hypothetical protein|nr:hypothetical protein [Oscillospiraceae bacterium]
MGTVGEDRNAGALPQTPQKDFAKGYFADGTELEVLAVPDEISRQVRGLDAGGRELVGYVRLTELREAGE